MTNANASSASRAPSKVKTISIGQRAGIWRVAVDGVFYGDYARRYWAIEAAFEKADEIDAGGGAAIITIAMDGQHDTTLYDTRRPAPSQGKARRRQSSLADLIAGRFKDRRKNGRVQAAAAG